MSDLEYFAHPYLNNSGLSKSKGETYVRRGTFEFGSLVHALILEPHRVDVIKRRLEGLDYQFTEEEIRTAKIARAGYMADPYLVTFLKSCSKEVAMYNANTAFHFNGVDFAIDTKRKYDLWNYAGGFGGDVKSTAATTHSEFLKHIDYYDYDRARVFYAKGSGADKDLVIGINKVTGQVFKVFMKKGCPLWTRGEQKLNELAHAYWIKNLPF
jgi:hypothetical protein